MIRAYNELYLEKARICLGRMLDLATHDLNYSLNDFWDKFLSSNIVNKLESGDVATVVGKSGVELAYEVLNDLEQDIKPRFTENRSIEYWTGWAIAYFQWKTSIPFLEITRVIPINEIANMYHPYHEMDINQLFDRMLQIFVERKLETNLKRKRKKN